MLWQKNYLALGLLGVLLLSATADNSVHILSKYGQQPLTSTTLKWLPVAHYNPNEPKEIVIGGFEIAPDGREDGTFINQAEKLEVKMRPLYVCRAMHSSVWVAGTQKDQEKRCIVTLHGTVQSYEKYELLENVDGAARIAWVRWSQFSLPLLGAVYVDSMLVARYKADDDKKNTMKSQYTHYIGTLNSNDNFGSIIYANENNEEKSAKSGELLVETEPIRYELSAVKLNWPKRRYIKREPRVLAEATITNTRERAVNMAEACTYSYKYSVYWGRRHAILNGLYTSITLVNGTSLPNVTWGTRRNENREDAYNVVVFLEPGTGVNVTLRGNYTDMEVPYTATLISHYEDSTATSRVISGTRLEESMFDVVPEFGPIYFLSNYSLVPTTVPPPTTEPTTTTTTITTTTTMTTTKQPQETSRTTHRHRQKNDDLDHDDNMIIPPKKPDISTGMQNDDGGPLSLKNKVEMTHGGACGVFKSGLLTLAPMLLLVLHRIT